MKIRIELNVPENVTLNEVHKLVQEFRYLAKLRGWKMLLLLPSQDARNKSGSTRRAD